MAEPVQGAEQAVTKKVGPLPLWGWLVGGTVLGGAFYLIFLRPSASSPAGGAVLPGSLLGTGGGGGDGGGGGGGTPSTTTATNATWLQNVVQSVATTTGLPVGQVYLYLTEWLAGTQPQGNPAAQSAFQKVIAAATQAGGQPPQAPTIGNVNLSPFSSNSTWLAQALGFLDPTVTGSVRQEIVNLFNGVGGANPTISPAADAAIQNLRAILGSEPIPLTYTVGSASPSVNTAEVVTSDRITALLAAAGQAVSRLGIAGVNQPSAETSIYQSIFPELSRQQALTAAEDVKAAFRLGILKPGADGNPDPGQVQRVIANSLNGIHPAAPTRTGQ